VAIFRTDSPTTSNGQRVVKDIQVVRCRDSDDGELNISTLLEIGPDRFQTLTCLSVYDLSVINYWCERDRQRYWRSSLALCLTSGQKKYRDEIRLNGAQPRM